MSRIIDPNKFVLLASVTDWLAVFRRQLDRARTPREIMAERKLERERLVQLRWLVAPDLGYPTEPFKVWRRPAMPIQTEKPINYSVTSFFSMRLVVFERPVVFVRIQVNASAAGAVLAYAGMPYGSPLVAMKPIPNGFSTLTLSGAAIQSLLISSSAGFQQITGLDHNAAEDQSWQLVEIVGLPTDAGWSGVLELDKPQGLVGSLGDARAAALDRYRRGAPFYGWEPTVPGGGNAPPWKLADPHAMLKVMDQSVLPPLRDMVTTHVPNQHAAFQVQHTLPPVDPMNPAQPGNDAIASFFPLQNLIFGAATDPLASLISGFGTAFEDLDIPPIVLADRKLFDDPTRSDWDFMVTAHYAKGIDGRSDPVEYAAIVFAPGVGTTPPVPANLGTELDGLRAPPVTDADWRSIIRVTWDKIADSLPFRVGSYAFARLPLAPGGTMTALMGPRPFDDALQPISATTSPQQELTGRLQALDESYELRSAPSPNVLLHALAHQDLFGLWSAWTSRSTAVAEPPVQVVPLISARLEPTPAAAGAPCPTSLILEFSWDWASRSPARIEIVGRMYAQAKLGDAPAAGPLPTVLQSTLSGGAAAVLQIVFNGAPSATVVTGVGGLTGQMTYLSLDGKTLLNSPAITAGPRRYRLTLTGLSLDFDTANRIGLALWARGVEQRAPNRLGDWSAQPLVASTADPRPPVIVIEREDVQLASVADANGEHHARIEWPSVAGAAGYFVYTTTEIKLRADRGMSDPAKSMTLSQRLAELRAAFANNPDRRSFTRVNAQPVNGTSMQVTLPRGSKEIHLYMVLGLSAGQIESEWPGPGVATGKRLICYAAPQIVLPSPPDIEVTRILDRSVEPHAYRAALRVRTKPGAAVARVDIHRVRVPEAAIELDTMGPPIARLAGSAAPFVVTPTVSDVLGEAQTLGTIQGFDPVEGSWRRVFYRAVAWSGNDPARGLYGGRSQPSAVREVIIPPADPPHLAPLTWHWPGGGLGDAQIDTNTLAPLAATPLGDHRLRADVLLERADGSAETLLRFPATASDDNRLEALGTSPPVTGHGLWRSTSGSSTGLHLLARRASTEDALKVRLMLIDPLGRATEKVIGVPAGSPLPEPDILNPQFTLQPPTGFFVQFATTVPMAATLAGPYRLRVRYAPAKPSPFPQLERISLRRLVDFDDLLKPDPGVRPLLNLQLDEVALPPVRPPVIGRPQVHTLNVALPDIPKLQTGENLFADSALIPVRRARGLLRQTSIVLALRGSSGHVELVIESPDGRTAKVLLTVQ